MNLRKKRMQRNSKRGAVKKDLMQALRDNPDGRVTYVDGNGIERWKSNHKPVYFPGRQPKR